MELPVTEPDDLPAIDRDMPAHEAPLSEQRAAESEQNWLIEIAEQLERDPDECWQALEGLTMLEADLRVSIIDELSGLGAGPGAKMLLRLLASARDPTTRATASAALGRIEGAAGDRLRLPASASAAPESAETAIALGNAGTGPSSLAPGASQSARPRLARSLVTPVDGHGRGSIVVSVNHLEQRRTAAFLCDVRLGIRDVVGEVEPDSPRAGGLIDALNPQPEDGSARDVPELAVGLLAGSLMLCGPNVPAQVRDWLLGTLGPDFRPAAIPATIPGLEFSSIPQSEMPARAEAVLEACQPWLDLSPLTFELAEEIWLREGRTAADPDRDAGAYRFLFEHRLIHRLELYRRMLLWMAWLWSVSGEIELARSALALAGQLADEQYAVPSHPFTVELTTRSLKAAQRRLRTAADPRA